MKLHSSSPLTTHPPHTSGTQPRSRHRRQVFAKVGVERARPLGRHSTRRELAIGGSSLTLLLSSFHEPRAQTVDGEENLRTITGQTQAVDKDYIRSTDQVQAEDVVPSAAAEIGGPKDDGSRKPTKSRTKAFIDVSIDKEPTGRIVVELDGDNAPAGAARFANLVSGGTGYRRKEFVKIMPNYIQHGGLRSYGVDAEIAKNTGASTTADELLSEWEAYGRKFPAVKNVAGSLGIIIRDPLKLPPKMKLVARKGKLEVDEESVGTDPNGTEFVITTRDSPELDASALVVGKVLRGMDVVERISKVKTVQENTSSPYFRVAKLIGDKRAVVAERGFNRPYSKIIITNCGLLDE